MQFMGHEMKEITPKVHDELKHWLEPTPDVGDLWNGWDTVSMLIILKPIGGGYHLYYHDLENDTFEDWWVEDFQKKEYDDSQDSLWRMKHSE